MTYKVKGKAISESVATPAEQRKVEREIDAFRQYQQVERTFVDVNEKICRARPVEETSEPEKKTAEAIQKEIAREIATLLQRIFAERSRRAFRAMGLSARNASRLRQVWTVRPLTGVR